MLPFDLPPPIPHHQPAPVVVDKLGLSLPSFVLVAQEKKPQAKKKKVSAEETGFNKAVSNFQQHLGKLPPKHKAEIRKIHGKVVNWADKARASGQRADKLSTFVGKVMAYSDKYLENIEKADPKLLQFKAEHKQFQALFLAGNQVIEAYLKWVRTDYEAPKKTRMPKRV